MAKRDSVWIDDERCTGCGACVDVCTVEAITIIDSRARVDQETCTECDACLEVCPQDAIQPVVEGELIQVKRGLAAVEERQAPVVQRVRPLVETAGPALAVAGAGLLAKVTRAAARAVGRWLSQSSEDREITRTPMRPEREASRANGRGRRMRRRRRGR